MIFAAARIFGSGPCDAAPSADLPCPCLARAPRACRERGCFDPRRLRDHRLVGLTLGSSTTFTSVCAGAGRPRVGWRLAFSPACLAGAPGLRSTPNHRRRRGSESPSTTTLRPCDDTYYDDGGGSSEETEDEQRTGSRGSYLRSRKANPRHQRNNAQCPNVPTDYSAQVKLRGMPTSNGKKPLPNFTFP